MENRTNGKTKKNWRTRKISHRKRNAHDRKRVQNREKLNENVPAHLDRNTEERYNPKVYEVPKKWTLVKGGG